ncbi:MAG: pyridoxamine 5'-phosphate oxidase family protein [Lentisphaerae bacterium]|jgi:predicted pyridoxine 5'-phosphate oxidase superfamily flavin-nucleotide-binding protein|nr:pyridoxamine 5'-phosphate oxidase family protein [Lentisphaerota bacterium]
MAKLTQELLDAWDNRDGPIIFATVDKTNKPNIIYASCLGRDGDDGLVVADNYFDKTRQNILAGTLGAILFRTTDKKTYQVKGSVEYYTSGPIYNEMKKWNPSQHPGHAAAVLRVESVYQGARRLI